MIRYFLILIIPIFIFSQNKKVFYYVENDSTISYRDEKNKFIIPPFQTYKYLVRNDLHKSEITENFFYIHPKNEREYAVNKEGNFLFYPFYYDNGPDYIKENYIRIKAKNGKVGFANKEGKIIIFPKYDFATPFNMGFSSYCNGCYFDRKGDEEHPPLVGGNWGYIDINGNEIIPTKNSKNPKDYILPDGSFIPYQFSYSKYELSLLNKILKFKKEINQNNISEGSRINFEIISKPSESNQYYFIKYYRMDKPNYFSSDFDDQEGFSFYIDKDENIFVNHLILDNDKNSYHYELIKLEDWIKK